MPGLSRWKWAGDHIVHECIVPSSRPARQPPAQKMRCQPINFILRFCLRGALLQRFLRLSFPPSPKAVTVFFKIDHNFYDGVAGFLRCLATRYLGPSKSKPEKLSQKHLNGA